MLVGKKSIYNFISELRQKFGRPASEDRKLIFRGEPAYYRAVRSSLLRKIEDSVKEVSPAAGKNAAKVFNSDKSYRILAREASLYFGGDIVRDREFEAIATLQHFGAPTPLIDFSMDWRIALYFACERFEYSCGRIIFFSCERAKNRYGLSVRKPSGHHHDNAGQTSGRQIDQESVLVWSENGKFKPDACHIQPIPRKHKPSLLAWLRSEGIHRESVYRDVHGYVGLINEAWPLVHAAERLIEQENYKDASAILKRLVCETKSPNISNIEQKGKALFLLGWSIEKQDKHKDALPYYKKSCKLLLHHANGTEPRLAAARCFRNPKKNNCTNAAIKSIDNLWK